MYDGTKYNRKFKALEAASGNIKLVTAHFNDQDKFDSFDWTTEPSESLSELITERCFQLRDKYDYLRLYFSGGSDSTTVLNYFIKNNIFIDEIVVTRNSMVDDFSCLSNFEVNEYVLPYLSRISYQLGNTKIKIIDIGSSYYESIMNDSFFYKKNSYDAREFYIPKINGKNFCNILCDADPFVINENDIWFDVTYDTNNFLEYKYRNIELFYYTPDLLKLHSKQCHILKKYIKKYPNMNYKTRIRTFLRDKPVAPEPDFLIKSSNSTSIDFRYYPKFKLILKNATPEQRNRYSAIMAQTIGGVNIVRLSDGIKVSKFNLGE